MPAYRLIHGIAPAGSARCVPPRSVHPRDRRDRIEGSRCIKTNSASLFQSTAFTCHFREAWSTCDDIGVLQSLCCFTSGEMRGAPSSNVRADRISLPKWRGADSRTASRRPSRRRENRAFPELFSQREAELLPVVSRSRFDQSGGRRKSAWTTAFLVQNRSISRRTHGE